MHRNWTSGTETVYLVFAGIELNTTAFIIGGVLLFCAVLESFFKICVGCNEESFGDKEKNGEGAYYNTYLRSYKINQDAFILIENFMVKDRYLFGVCDGHGINGHFVSDFIKEILP